MKYLYEVIDKIKAINTKYDLSNSDLDKIKYSMDNFKVCTPFIGSFSVGKTSIINAIIESDFLKTDITPETAVATEIVYGNEDKFQIIEKDKTISLNKEEFKNYEINPEHIDLIEISYNNEFLKRIKDVKLVDLPGFESGIQVHEQAIKDYIAKSLAYIIVFSADNLVIKESIADFLIQLNQEDIPICVVINKCDKVTEKTLQEGIQHLKENLPKYIDSKDIKFCYTKTKKDRDIDQLKDYLISLQNQSKIIFQIKFSKEISLVIDNLKIYLNSRLKNQSLDLDQLNYEEEKIKKDIENLKNQIEEKTKTLMKQSSQCVDSIASKINTNLKDSARAMADTAINGGSINEKINSIVKKVVTQEIKISFEPKMKKYLKEISEIFQDTISQQSNLGNDNKIEAKYSTIESAVKQSLPILVPAIGSAIGGILGSLTGLGSIAGPVGMAIGIAAGALVEGIVKQKKLEEARENAYREIVNTMIPTIVSDVQSNLEIEFTDFIDEITAEIQIDMDKKIQAKQKSIEDIKNQREKAIKTQEEIKTQLKEDIDSIRRIEDELRR